MPSAIVLNEFLFKSISKKCYDDLLMIIDENQTEEQFAKYIADKERKLRLVLKICICAIIEQLANYNVKSMEGPCGYHMNLRSIMNGKNGGLRGEIQNLMGNFYQWILNCEKYLNGLIKQ